MAIRNDFKQVVAAKRKYGVFEILGNLVIWLAPVITMLIVFLYKGNKFKEQKTSFYVELASVVVLIIMFFVYLKWGRIKIHEQYVADKSRAEKHNPLLVLGNGFLNLMPIILGILIADLLSNLGEPLKTYLIVILIEEIIGRILLLIDSFIAEVYY